MNNGTKQHQCLYVIQPEIGGSIKLGISMDVERRLSEHQATSPVRLVLVGYLRTNLSRKQIRGLESRIHRALSNSRLWGEWFVDSPSVREYVRTTFIVLERAIREEGHQAQLHWIRNRAWVEDRMRSLREDIREVEEAYAAIIERHVDSISSDNSGSPDMEYGAL